METTSPQSGEIRSAQFQSLSVRLNRWRATRRRGQRIPEPIWKAAVALGRVHGLNATAAALKLNYYDLQRRLGTGSVRRAQSPVEPRFIEVAPPPGAGLSQATSLEWVRASGSRVILRLPHASFKELQPLVQLFLRQRS